MLYTEISSLEFFFYVFKMVGCSNITQDDNDSSSKNDTKPYKSANRTVYLRNSWEWSYSPQKLNDLPKKTPCVFSNFNHKSKSNKHYHILLLKINSHTFICECRKIFTFHEHNNYIYTMQIVTFFIYDTDKNFAQSEELTQNFYQYTYELNFILNPLKFPTLHQIFQDQYYNIAKYCIINLISFAKQMNVLQIIFFVTNGGRANLSNFQKDTFERFFLFATDFLCDLDYLNMFDRHDITNFKNAKYLARQYSSFLCGILDYVNVEMKDSFFEKQDYLIISFVSTKCYYFFYYLENTPIILEHKKNEYHAKLKF
ncbi:hypothetical protein EDEG_02299 [Edhazardia aedis USNM 41457]|uniref:Uncharacterized protein n=1 Tax=Edhazardia aedis (strain USNM 41457) TaxID=1003232 RepID=J9DPS4_EDHAE|nr:hypothetical protein EDEG_02299 [Edhazardia aedis USNM 41457]|eukprot:EJW03367.1 hypothetical protein EDEG_02299 [Edhazardia aedis USNM 41457]